MLQGSKRSYEGAWPQPKFFPGPVIKSGCFAQRQCGNSGSNLRERMVQKERERLERERAGR